MTHSSEGVVGRRKLLATVADEISKTSRTASWDDDLAIARRLLKAGLLSGGKVRKMRIPKRLDEMEAEIPAIVYARRLGWNSCLDEVKRMNPRVGKKGRKG